MNSQCKHCQASFEIMNDDLRFLEKVSPVIGGKKYPLPPPTLCPDCRAQRRYAFRNERNIYKGTCNFSGKTIASAYSPDKPYRIYESDIWWSDKWDPLVSGKSFNTSESFFTQMDALMRETPLVSLLNFGGENSEYVLNAGYNKDCYMLFCASYNERCFHCYWTQNSISCIDCMGLRKCERCYECLDCLRCFDLQYSQNCVGCTSSAYLWDCMGCTNCLGCTNLRNKSNCWFNEQLTSEEFAERMKQFLASAQEREKTKIAFVEKKTGAMHPWSNQRMNEMCTGDYIYESNHCRYCFDTRQSENCSYCQHAADMKDSADVTYIGLPGELLYECNNLGLGAYHCLFSSYGYGMKESLYCYNCHFCEWCFGCVSLHRKKYCILNKQYSEQEYNDLVPTIIEHMRKAGEYGEFFPASISPFGYNETVASEYFPLKKEEAKAQGFVWSDYESPIPHVNRVIPANQLPATIDQIPNDITNWAIECEATRKPFRIVRQELDFYRDLKLPVPHLHPDERHRRRMALRNPRKLWNRKCAKCSEQIATSYAPERPETVYCEKCYLDAVY